MIRRRTPFCKIWILFILIMTEMLSIAYTECLNALFTNIIIPQILVFVKCFCKNNPENNKKRRHHKGDA